jgi:crotonobetainyl-CoA:carnitine CoA-transferase CaiB-like acyl-CoA transferase
MEKEQMKALLGHLIFVQSLLRKMEQTGFDWEKIQEINDNLRLIIIDLEKAID